MLEKCTPLCHEARLEGNMIKTPHVRSTFGSGDVAKVRSCGAKRVLKSKGAKHSTFGTLLEVAMLKKCALWREAYFEVKMLKHSACSDHFCKLRCWKSTRRCGAKHFSKSKCEKRTAFGPLLCTFKRRFVWQAQWVFAPCQKWVKHVDIQKRWQAWGIWKGFAKMRAAWQPQYTRHLHQRCWEVRALISWETQATTPTTRTPRTAKRKRCRGGEDRGSSLERQQEERTRKGKKKKRKNKKESEKKRENARAREMELS